MKCADPVLCYTNEKGRRLCRHFTLANDEVKRLHQLVFDCGQCLFCRKKRSYELAARCVLHASLYKDNCFLTLTYDEKKEGYHNDFQYEDIQKFKKRLRRHCRDKKIQLFNVHEYGKNSKKHWHLICFNHNFDDKTLHTRSSGLPLFTSRTLQKLWPHGFSTIGDVSTASAMYQAQYVEKDLKNGNRTNKKKSHSKHSGIARPYFLKHYRQLLTLGYVPINGTKIPLPRYFEKLSHRHWCHFYAPGAFKDTHARKALYRPFKRESPNKEIADLWTQYFQLKEQKIAERQHNWDQLISEHLTSKSVPDFIKSEFNALYDLKNKNTQEKF